MYTDHRQRSNAHFTLYKGIVERLQLDIPAVALRGNKDTLPTLAFPIPRQPHTIRALHRRADGWVVFLRRTTPHPELEDMGEITLTMRNETLVGALRDAALRIHDKVREGLTIKQATVYAGQIWRIANALTVWPSRREKMDTNPKPGNSWHLPMYKQLKAAGCRPYEAALKVIKSSKDLLAMDFVRQYDADREADPVNPSTEVGA